MRAVRIGLASALVGCAPEEEQLELPIDVCGQDEPVQILALEDEQVIHPGDGGARYGERWLFGVRTFEIPLTKVNTALGDPTWRPYRQIDATITATGDCGEDPRVVAEGLDVIASRVEDDEPWLACSSLTPGLHWFDPDGAWSPQLVSDHLQCGGYLVIDQSVVFYGGDGELARARLENGEVVVDVLLDGIEYGEYLPPYREVPPDELVAVRNDDTVVAVDLRTGEIRMLTEGIASTFSISPNRRWLVWYEALDEGLQTRIWLRDLQEGGDTQIGRDDWAWIGVDIGDSFMVVRGEAMWVPASTHVLALPSRREEWIDDWIAVRDERDGLLTLDVGDDQLMRFDPETGDRQLIELEYDELLDGAFWSRWSEPHASLALPEAMLPWDIVRATFDAPAPELVRERVFSSVDLGDDRWIVGSERDENELVDLEYLDGDTLEHRPFATDVVPGSIDSRSDSSIAAPWRTDELIYQVHTRASDRTGVWRVRFGAP
jgi:hypothetical protein